MTRRSKTITFQDFPKKKMMFLLKLAIPCQFRGPKAVFEWLWVKMLVPQIVGWLLQLATSCSFGSSNFLIIPTFLKSIEIHSFHAPK